MTGPEHYKEAERLLAKADYYDELTTDYAAYLVSQAQVHATLALAAATAVVDLEWAGATA